MNEGGLPGGFGEKEGTGNLDSDDSKQRLWKSNCFSPLSPAPFGFKRMLFSLREQCMSFQHPYFFQADVSIPMGLGTVKLRE